jgi:hypothetical protein
MPNGITTEYLRKTYPELVDEGVINNGDEEDKEPTQINVSEVLDKYLGTKPKFVQQAVKTHLVVMNIWERWMVIFQGDEEEANEFATEALRQFNDAYDIQIVTVTSQQLVRANRSQE